MSQYRRPWSGKQAPQIRRRLLARDGPWCARCGRSLPEDLKGVDISHAPGADVALNPAAEKRLDMFELQLEHRSCNCSHGARLGNALRRGPDRSDAFGPVAALSLDHPVNVGCNDWIGAAAGVGAGRGVGEVVGVLGMRSSGVGMPTEAATAAAMFRP